MALLRRQVSGAVYEKTRQTKCVDTRMVRMTRFRPMKEWTLSQRCRPLLLLLLGCTFLPGTGCRSIGPGTVSRDRLDYSQSIANSWKHQTLLNLVRLRYSDTPIFLEVGQIVSGYTLETSVDVSGEIARVGAGDTFLGLGASGKYTDRPTITYTPLTGDEFVSDLMRPIPINNVFGLLLAGSDADFVLELGVSRLNGLKNASVKHDQSHPADPKFLEAIKLLRQIQEADALELNPSTNGAPNAVMELVFLEKDVPEETRSQIRELKRLLNLEASRNEYTVVPGLRRGAEGTLTVSSRSVLQIMVALSGMVDVPQEDVDAGRTFASFDVAPGAERLLRIHSTNAAPTDAYAAVRYRHRWFWVDDRDWLSKRTLSTIQLLFSLANPSRQQHLPLITIPTQ